MWQAMLLCAVWPLTMGLLFLGGGKGGRGHHPRCGDGVCRIRRLSSRRTCGFFRLPAKPGCGRRGVDAKRIHGHRGVDAKRIRGRVSDL